MRGGELEVTPPFPIVGCWVSVPGADDLIVDRRGFTAKYQSPEGWTATMVVESPAGLPLCRSLLVTAPEGVRTRTLRQLNLDTILRRSASLVTWRAHETIPIQTNDDRFSIENQRRQFLSILNRPMPHGRTRLTDDFLVGVAEAVRRAERERLRKVDTVMEYGREVKGYPVSPSTAYHWISDARTARKLPRARRRSRVATPAAAATE